VLNKNAGGEEAADADKGRAVTAPTDIVKREGRDLNLSRSDGVESSDRWNFPSALKSGKVVINETKVRRGG
jgi:hypothetical protein